MEAHIKLGRLFGIRIGLHYSWIIIAILIALSLASHFASVNRQWTPTVVWAAAIITALLFFGGIVLHEMGHALVAKARGISVPSITLFALGGVAQIEKESAEPKTEFWMGIAGPLVSVALGMICLGIARGIGWAPMSDPTTPAVAVLVWLGYINLVLAVFNMIPGYPLDGGRVLRAIVWWYTGNMERATRIAAGVGQLFASGFILMGLWRFFSGQGFGGLWLAFIGWFLLDAARSSYAHVEAMAVLRGVRVRDVMTPDCALVDADTNLKSLVEERLLRTGTRCFVVEKDGYLAGLITPHDIGKIERERWPEITVAEAMRPLRELRTVSPQTLVTDALDLMTRQNINQLPVVTNGRLEGMLSRGHVLHLLQTRADLHM